MTTETATSIFRQGRRRGWWRAWLILLLPLLLLFALSIGYGAYLIRVEGVEPADISDRVGPAVPFIMLANHTILLLIVLWFVRLDGLRLSDIGWRAPQGAGREIIIGVAAAFLIFVAHQYVVSPIVANAMTATGAPDLRLASRSNPLGSNLLLALLTGVWGGGVVEETLYRGYALTRLSERMPTALAAAAMLIFFCLLHAALGLSGMIIATSTGLMLTLLFIWRQSLIAPMIAHAGVNILVLVL